MTLLRHDLPQGDDAWLALRAGKLTSTGAKCILPLAALTGEGKADIAKTRQSYLWKLVAERLSGVPVKDGFTNDAMERGSRVEPEARAAYAAWCGDDPYIDTPGFLEIEGQWWGDSPDGVIYGPDGAIARTVELKCPEGYNHMTWRDAGRVPNEYLRQCVHHLAVLGTAERCTSRRHATRHGSVLLCRQNASGHDREDSGGDQPTHVVKHSRSFLLLGRIRRPGVMRLDDHSSRLDPFCLSARQIAIVSQRLLPVIRTGSLPFLHHSSPLCNASSSNY
jgi:hypothetical protein